MVLPSKEKRGTNLKLSCNEKLRKKISNKLSEERGAHRRCHALSSAKAGSEGERVKTDLQEGADYALKSPALGRET